MGAGAGGSSVGVDGKDVAGAAQGADGHPATVQAKTHVLDLRRDKVGKVRGEDKNMHKLKITENVCLDNSNILAEMTACVTFN